MEILFFSILFKLLLLLDNHVGRQIYRTDLCGLIATIFVRLAQ